MYEFSIVIPAYNESDKIVPTLTQVVTFMRNFSDSFEVVVVDDGSEDNTVELIEKHIKEYPEIKLVKNPHKGKGPTVWTGIMTAEGRFIYMADADLSTPIEELKGLFHWMMEHDFDIVIASREGVGADRVNEPYYRHLMGRLFNYVVQLIALPGIKDSQCGFKLFRKKAAKEIFRRLEIYGKDAKELDKGYMGAFDVEVLYLARKLGFKIKEVSVTWRYVKTTRLNPVSDSIKMVIDVIKVRVNDVRGLYKV